MCGAFAVGASVRGSLCRTYNRVVYVWGLTYFCARGLRFRLSGGGVCAVGLWFGRHMTGRLLQYRARGLICGDLLPLGALVRGAYVWKLMSGGTFAAWGFRLGGLYLRAYIRGILP